MSTKRAVLVTKDCLSAKNTNFRQTLNAGFGTSVRADQHNSINLNQNYKCEDLKLVQFGSNLSNNKRSDYGVVDHKNYNDKNDVPDSWKKTDLSKSFKNLCISQENSSILKNEKNKDKNSSKNASTLSLHIAAYENSNEAAQDIEDDATMKPFKLPRQQQETVEFLGSEMMQFKTSTKLCIPNMPVNLSMSAVSRVGSKLPFAIQQQQIVQARTFYQNPYYARFKKFKVSPDFHKHSTGLTGLFVEERPHQMLKLIYGRLLRALQDVPATSAYRRYTEETIMHRLSLVENESDIQKLEEKFGMGQIEEVIEQAQAELETTRAIIDSKAWEPLIEAPAQNQWRWPIA